MLRLLRVNGAMVVAAVFVIGCSKAGAPTTRQSEVTHEGNTTRLSKTASEGSPPHARIYRLYEAGKLVEARSALLKFVRENAEPSIKLKPSRQIDVETKLAIGVVANVVSHCIDMERIHGEPRVFPQKLREAARLTREALDTVIGQVGDAVAGNGRLAAQLVHALEQKQSLVVAEIGALRSAGDTGEVRALAERYSGFFRSRGIALDDRGVPLARRPGKASLSTTNGSQEAARGADGQARRTKPADQDRKRNVLSETATSFWKTLADGNTEGFKRFYAERITLKAGSELLKPRWGIASDRGKDAVLPRDKLMAGYARMIGEFGRDKWRRAFSKIGEGSLAATVVAEPDRPFPGTRKGDRLLAVVTGVGDDKLLYVFRRQGTEWRIVLEVTDY